MNVSKSEEGGPIFMKDKWFYRAVVAILGVTVIVTLGAYIFFTINDKDTPDALIAIGSAAVGSLGGLFK